MTLPDENKVKSKLPTVPIQGQIFSMSVLLKITLSIKKVCHP